MATLAQLYDALKNADAAGAADDARTIADEIYRRKSMITKPEGPGLGANVAAATKDVAYGVAGAPVDIGRTIINTLTQPDNPVSRAATSIPGLGPVISAAQQGSRALNVPAIPENTIGSSRWLAQQGEKIGIVDPAKVEAVTPVEKIVRAGTEAALYTAAPEMLLGRLKQLGIVGDQAARIAGSIVGDARSGAAITRNAVTGGAAGATAEAAQDAVPEQYRPLAAVLGSLVGGTFGTLAETSARRVGNALTQKTGEFLDPMRGTAGVERTAARRLAAGLDATPSETIAAIDAAGPAPSGAPRTLAEVTGDRGAATMQAAARRADAKPFEDLAAAQAKAQAAALKRIQRTGGAEDMVPALEAHGKRVDDLLTRIDDTVQARGQQVAADLSAGRLDEATAGEQLRTMLADQREATRRIESTLYKAVDPDKTLISSSDNLLKAHEKLTAEMSDLAKPLTGEPKDIIDTVAALPDKVPYSDLVALKSRITTAMRNERVSSGKSDTWRQLSLLSTAVRQDLNNPLKVLAKEQARAVKAGELAPEDTWVAKIRAINDELDQHAATFGTADGGVGTARAGPPPTGAGHPGADRAAGIEPAGTASGAGVPPAGEPALGAAPATPADIIDTDAAQRLARANEATIARVNAFDTGLHKRILARPSEVNPYTMPAEQIPSKIFAKGTAGGENVTNYRSAVGDVAALPVLEAHAIDDVTRVAARPDGTLDPKRLAKWRSDHSEALRAFPALDARVANATAATEAAGRVAAVRRAKVQETQKSIAASLAGVRDPAEITARVGSIFNRADAVTQMQRLRQAMRGNPDALAGLRRSVVDHIESVAVQDAKDLTGDTVNGAKLAAFVRDNADTLKAAGFSAPEIEHMAALGDEAARAAEVMRSARPGPSKESAFIQDLLKLGTEAHSSPTSLFLNIATRSAVHSVLPTVLGGPLAGATAFLGAALVNRLRAKGLQTVDELFHEALLDPELAKRLLAKVNKRNVRPVVNAFRQQVMRSTLGGALAAESTPGGRPDPMGIR